MIVKSPTCESFTTVKNSFVNAPLSWGARGVGLYLLSKPADWKILVDDLVRQSDLGEKGVRTLLQELEQAGYLAKAPQRSGSGKYEGCQWIMYDEPRSSKPRAAKRHPVKDGLLNTDKELKTDEEQNTQPSLLDELTELDAKPVSTPPKRERKIAVTPVPSLLTLWKTHFPAKPQPIAIRGTRLRLLAARWQDGIKRGNYTAEEGVLWWDQFLGWCAGCKAFQKPFFNFDWLIKPDNFDKVVEGVYSDWT